MRPHVQFYQNLRLKDPFMNDDSGCAFLVYNTHMKLWLVLSLQKKQSHKSKINHSSCDHSDGDLHHSRTSLKVLWQMTTQLKTTRIPLCAGAVLHFRSMPDQAAWQNHQLNLFITKLSPALKWQHSRITTGLQELQLEHTGPKDGRWELKEGAVHKSSWEFCDIRQMKK